MRKIGITGGIGTGKTTVCKIFELLNIPIYYADDRAKWLMNNSLEIKSKIINHFGNEAYTLEDLNRTYLAQQVFKNKENNDLINSIVHPVVGDDFKNWISLQKAPYILKEAALMFESNSYKQVDDIICVTAPIELRIERVLKRDTQRTKEDILNIINKQLSEKEKIERSNYIVTNDEKSLLIPQVLKIHEEITFFTH